MLLKLGCVTPPYRAGSNISPVMPNGDENPIAFGSQTLSKAKRNHAQAEKEALVINKMFYQYIYGQSN